MIFKIGDVVLCAGADKLNASHKEIESAVQVMGQMLDRSKDGPFVLDLAISEGAKLKIQWNPTSVSGGEIDWIKGDVMVAATLVCSGVFPEEDEKLVSNFIARCVLTEVAVNTIRGMVSPFMSTIYFDPTAITDLKVCGLSIGFGRTFFTRLAQSRPPERRNLA